jgi:carboxyl-terminal processing protease
VAGALRDYGRAVLVGGSQTHGKGTVQKVIDLGLVRMPGRVKVTFQQYFLARGDSVQDRGVTPDIQVPGPKLMEEFLERKQEGAIPWASIPGRLDDDHADVKRYNAWKAGALPGLKIASAARVAQTKDFEIYKKMEATGDDPEAPPEHPPKEGPPGVRKKADRKDPQMDEAAHIVQDAIPLWAKEAVVKK